MKIIFNANIVLDVTLDGKPFSLTAAKLFLKVESKELVGLLGATIITTIHYIARKTVGTEKARNEIEKLFKLCEIAPIDKSILESTMKSKIKDLKDVVLCEASKNVGVDAIVTRNPIDFKHGTLPVYLPEELLKKLNEEKKKIKL
ncbi:MAG: PIN domain-containing protein [Candidatus Hodarchaeota archaeon]